MTTKKTNASKSSPKASPRKRPVRLLPRVPRAVREEAWVALQATWEEIDSIPHMGDGSFDLTRLEEAWEGYGED